MNGYHQKHLIVVDVLSETENLITLMHSFVESDVAVELKPVVIHFTDLLRPEKLDQHSR